MSPGAYSPRRLENEPERPMEIPLTLVMMSPVSRPASAAGLPSITAGSLESVKR